jgi:hypothetical protein
MANTNASKHSGKPREINILSTMRFSILKSTMLQQTLQGNLMSKVVLYWTVIVKKITLIGNLMATQMNQLLPG